jgi:hypothetical protein
MTVERLMKMVGWTEHNTVSVMWNSRTKAVTVIYTDGEGGRIAVNGGRAESMQQAERMVRSALENEV